MDAEEFIDAIKSWVRNQAIKDVIHQLVSPSGRLVPENVKRRAEWYRNLNDSDREMLREVVAEATDSAIFGLLCMIDGVRVIENTYEKGKFELYFVKEGKKLLNSPDIDFLHDLYNS
jgi:hypothetical protein